MLSTCLYPLFIYRERGEQGFDEHESLWKKGWGKEGGTVEGAPPFLERFPLPSPDFLLLHLVNRRTVTLHAADGELVLDGAGVASSGLIVAVVFVEGAEPPLHTEDAAHDLAHAEVGGGEQHAAKEQQEQ